MKILAIDSSGLVASAAIWEGELPANEGRILAVSSTDYKKTHSQTLLPMIDRICRDTDCKADDFDAVAVSAGPGSFTGLRIGSATAKAIALVSDIPVIEVPTLMGLAYNFWGSDRLVCPLMDARRNQVYTGLYAFENGDMVTVKDQTATGLDEILDAVRKECEKKCKGVIFLGDGADAYREEIKKLADFDHVFAPPHLNRQDASGVAVIAAGMYREGKTVSADDHKPVYLRTSQAEREGAKNFDLRSVNS